MNTVNSTALTLCLLGALPMAALAQISNFGPAQGEREFSISGTGSSDQKFDSGTFGVAGDMGWYLQDHMVAGVRQSINYASIEGESIDDDFWNGSTRGYLNYQFLFSSTSDASNAFQDDGAWAYTTGLGYNF